MVLKFRGRVESGLGEGKLFLGQSEYLDGLQQALGWRPMAGTLNLRLQGPQIEESKQLRDRLPGCKVAPGFQKNGRTFGEVLAYAAQVSGQPAGLVIPLRTAHGPEIIELVAPVWLREKFSLKDGDEIEIEVRLE